jgi:hypothetical protein
MGTVITGGTIYTKTYFYPNIEHFKNGGDARGQAHIRAGTVRHSTACPGIQGVLLIINMN